MKNIKKSQLAVGLMALTIISAVGISSATLAAGTDTSNVNATSTTSHFRVGKAHIQPTAAQLADMAVKKTEMTTKKTAIEAALTANDYNAWVLAEGPNAPILKTINATNFSRYVEAHNLRQQSDTIMTELGLTKGEGRGEGMGMGMGGHFEAK